MANSQLSSDDIKQCVEMISKWRGSPDFSPHCPVCQNPDIQITDHSSRPHTEWYRILCQSCGLEHFVTLSLGSSAMQTER